MKNKSVLSGALVLAVSSILAKIFSAVYRIALTRILGGVGIGIYQLVFPLYSLCVVLSSAGIPMAISKVISKHPEATSSVIKKCLFFTCAISMILSFLLVVFCKPLAKIQGEKDIYICYLILAPTIIVVGLCSVLRGVFQGRGRFAPSAISSVAEQFVKLALGLGVSLFFVRFGVFKAIVGAIVSIGVSELVSLAVLLVFFKKNAQKTTKNVPFKAILRDVLPITFTNSLLPIACFVDSLLVVNLLKFNFTKSEAFFMYGLETGAVGGITGLPTIFSFAIASVVLPSVTKNVTNKHLQFELSFKTILVLTLPFVFAFLFVPKPILLMLYGKRFLYSGKNGLVLASRLLQISGIGVLFMATNQLFSSSLQAVENRRATVKNLSIAVVVKFVVELLLLPTKFFNIYALSIANTLCYFVVMLLNLKQIKLQFSFNNNYFNKLLLCNLLFVLVAMLANFMGVVAGFVCFVLSCFVYVGCLFYFDVFSFKDKAYLKYKML